MLKINPLTGAQAHSRPAEERSVDFDIAALLGVFRRQWRLMAGTTAVVLLLAVVYLMTAQSRYTASSSIMVDTKKNQAFASQQMPMAETPLDAGAVESQVEILRSETVALAVIKELKLTEDPEFVGAGKGLIRSLLSAVLPGPGDGQSDLELERRAVEVFERGLAVRRLGLTYVIQVDFTALDPAKAARIANAIADAYMVGELEARYQSTRRASRWLQDRIKELREQAAQADSAVQSFKTEHNIIDTGRGLMSDQQLADVNTQIVAARAATAEAKARLDRIQQIAASDVPDATVTDALRSDVINRLRAQYLDIAAREAEWSQRYGVNHTAAVNLRNQMREIRRSISDELRRIAETYKSEYEIARAREQSIQESLAKLVDQAALTGQAQIKLRDLESASQTYRNLYDNFLQRFMEATQQQTFPITEARVITAASEPLKRSSPRTSIVLAAATVMGLCLGFGGALLRERLDNVFRTPAQVEQLIGAECLGILPILARDGALPAADIRYEVPEGRGLSTAASLNRRTVEAPFSRFTETLRSVKVAADISGLTRETRVIGVVSAIPNEGKTLVASNLAQLVAHAGQRALLIDADLRNPSMTRALAPDATEGLIEVLSERRDESQVRWVDPVTGLHFIPAVVGGRMFHTAELVASPAMSKLIVNARQHYDFVFVDLPPVAPVVDVRAASHLLDGFVFVIEWGRTSQDVVLEALASAELVRERMVGVVLNKADPKVLKRQEGYKGRYYHNYYSDYGTRA